VQQYKDGVQIKTQQGASRLRDAVTVEMVNGEGAFFDQIGSTAAVQRTTRHGDTPLVETPHSRRYLTLADYEWADLIDDQDKIRTLNDPTSPYQRNAAMAMGRSMDDVIIAAFNGTAKTGKDGSGSTVFDATNNEIAVGATGLTLAKLLTTREILMRGEVDLDEPAYFAVTAKQLMELLGTTEVKSADYNTVKALVQGQVDTFMGFKFIQTERLTLDGSSDRRCLAWVKSGLTLGIGKDITARIDERADKSYSTQVYTCMSLGAVRMQETQVVRIICNE
jgi:hypothetical protein